MKEFVRGGVTAVALLVCPLAAFYSNYALYLSAKDVETHKLTFNSKDVSNVSAKDVETHKTLLNNESHCLTFEDDMNRRVADASNVIVVMPAKAGGSTMRRFINHCYPGIEYNERPFHTNTGLHKLQSFISSSLHLPKLIHTHIAFDSILIRLIKTVPDDFLIIFVYREESDRKVSALKQVLDDRLCGRKDPHKTLQPTIKRNETHCVYEDEEEILKSAVGEGIFEIGRNINGILSCDTHDAIEDTNPNLMMMSVSQINQLQPILAKYHCPEILPKLPINWNIASDKKEWVYVRTRENGAEVKLEEWAKSKKQFLDWAYNTDEEIQKFCRAKTRKLQNEMNRCNDQLIDLRRNEV